MVVKLTFSVLDGRMHVGTPVCDMDNQFFLDLASPQKWVSSKVCVFLGMMSLKCSGLNKLLIYVGCCSIWRC